MRVPWLLFVLAACGAEPASPPDPDEVLYVAVDEEETFAEASDSRFSQLPAPGTCELVVRVPGELHFRLADRDPPPPRSRARPWQSEVTGTGRPAAGSWNRGVTLAELRVRVDPGDPVRFHWRCDPERDTVMLSVRQGDRAESVEEPIPLKSRPGARGSGGEHPGLTVRSFKAGEVQLLYALEVWPHAGSRRVLKDEAGFPQEVDYGDGLLPISKAREPYWTLSVEFTPGP